MTGDGSLKMLFWRVTKNATMTSDESLKRLFWRVTEKATMTSDGSLKRLFWHVIENVTMMGDGSLKMLWWWVMITKKAILMYHWKDYDDEWRVTENAILMCHWTCYDDGSLKRLWCKGLCMITCFIFLLNYRWYYYTRLEAIKAHHEKQEVCINIAHMKWLANNRSLGRLGGEREIMGE
jgi:hypothetical protein